MMKRTLYYLGLICGLVCWSTSCSNDNDEAMGDTIPIRLSAQSAPSKQTKAIINDDGQPLLADMAVGVYIFENGGVNASISANLHYKVSATGKLELQSGVPPCYPASGNGVKISAYYPYASGATDSYDFTVATNQSTDQDYNASDLLFSSQTAYSRQTAAHTLGFTHKLSRITYTLGTSGSDAPSLSGATVSVVNLLPTIEFNRTTGALGSAKGVSTPVYANLTNQAAIVVPQTIASGSQLMKISAGGNNYYYKPQSTLVLESGKSYNFAITVVGTQLQVSYTITNWENGTVDDNNGLITAYTYRIGDYYPDPNVTFSAPGVVSSGTAPVGIVFRAKTATQAGLVVSLDEGIGLMWSTLMTYTYATDPTNGATNMSSVDYYLSNNSGKNWSYFPAFNWCRSTYGSGTPYAGQWYLPAKEELEVLCTLYRGDKSYINGKLTGGGTELSDDVYWSSTEDDKNYAQTVSLGDGQTNLVTKYINNIKVRAVLAF